MTRYVAFLRAINVTGRRLTMDKLKAEFEALGFDDVSTYIASGNVIFEATGTDAELERRIESHLDKALGYEVATFVRTSKEIAKLAAAEPFKGKADGDSHYVGFLRTKPSATAKKATEALSGDHDELRIVGRELHWLVHGRFMDSEVKPKDMERALGNQQTTTRNTTMLRKLAAKLDA